MNKTYENPNELKPVSSDNLIENYIIAIDGDYHHMTDAEKLKHKKDLEELAEILREEYADL
ncbi:MAG: hypothetical protein M1416_02285 [Candidatus Pacearchaeota archaeon]|nr:hypothetical protein [Candidatus Pacearchaeota archaeon]